MDVASAEYLLAMKLFSSRVEADADDIALLYREVGYSTVEEGLSLVERSYRPSVHELIGLHGHLMDGGDLSRADLLEEGASAPGATRGARMEEYLTVLGLK